MLIRTLALALGICLAAHVSAQEGGGYVGDEACAACHADPHPQFTQTVHAKVIGERNARNELMRRGCEACHGPGRAHVEAPGRGELIAFDGESSEPIARENAACLACHSGERRLYWEGSAHESVDVGCTSCHEVTKQVSERYQLAHRSETDTCAVCHPIQRSRLFRNAHMPLRPGEDKMSCSSCHNTHGTVSEALIAEVSTNESCYRCHAEKRGPFLWEHPPVNEDCLSCHDPHGSTRARMLRVSLPRLCQQCHIGTLHPGDPRAPGDRFVLGGSCLNCHPTIHGSNHPSGFAFTR